MNINNEFIFLNQKDKLKSQTNVFQHLDNMNCRDKLIKITV